MTWFYFAGHGVRRSRSDTVLLLEDFGAAGATLACTADLGNLIEGMSPSAARRLARTQLYFVDACRVLPEKFKRYESLQCPPVFDVELEGDDRNLAIYFAALPGRLAYARPARQTVFSEALLHCLSAGAGQPGDLGQWSVSTYDLDEALTALYAEFRERGEQHSYRMEGRAARFPICRLLQPPQVELAFHVDPEEAAAFTRVDLRALPGPGAWTLPTPVRPHPHRLTVQGGFYEVRAAVEPPPRPNYRDLPPDTLLARPPRRAVTVRMCP
jgi:hypothetical protein